VKVPKPPAPPPGPGGDHDTAWVRKNVKGAAGGMAGVDYADESKSAAADEKKASAKSKSAKGGHQADGSERPELAPDRPKELRESVRLTELALEDEEVHHARQRKRKKRRHSPARDRAIDKDAPDLIKSKRLDPGDEEHEEREHDRDFEFDLDAILEKQEAPRESRAHLFARDERPDPGDPSLFDPDEIQRALGTPAAYAKHVMILAEAFRVETGAHRHEAIDYLARMFVALSDKSFGRLAIKEFGPQSGIIDIYPLEVVDHVLRRYPGFLAKTGFGSFFQNVPESRDRWIKTNTEATVILEYAPDLKIRGFAIQDGGRPGYAFEPEVEPGKYRLHIQSAGKFVVLISALNRSGYTTIDRLRIQVRPRRVKDLPGLAEEQSFYPERDEARVKAWPMPEPPVIDYRDLLEEEDARPAPAVMASGELIRMQQLDALRGPHADASPLELEVRAAFEIDRDRDLAVADLELLRDAVESVLEALEIIADEVSEDQSSVERAREHEGEAYDDTEPFAEVPGGASHERATSERAPAGKEGPLQPLDDEDSKRS
jgi:hypothetical protein